MTDKNSLGMSTARQVHHNTASQHQCTHTGQLKHMKDMHTSPLPRPLLQQSITPHTNLCTYVHVQLQRHSLSEVWNVSPVWGWYWAMGYLSSAAQAPAHEVLRGLQARHTHTHTHTYTHTQAYRRARSHAHMHAHTHTCTPSNHNNTRPRTS